MIEGERRETKRRNNWGKESRGEEEVEAVCFVPATPGGELARLLQEGDDVAREGTKQKRLKFVERGGSTIKDRLCRNNPWGKIKCGRENCLSCPESKE